MGWNWKVVISHREKDVSCLPEWHAARGGDEAAAYGCVFNLIRRLGKEPG